MNTTARTVALLLMATSLGACQQNVFKGLFGAKADVSATTMKRAQSNGLVALEEGRAYLRRGQIAAAVASFKIARLDPVVAADANNGIGVAYAKLGRPDVADRYFRAALRIEPSNERFAGNLMRLQREVLLAAAKSEPVREVEVERVAERPKPSFEETFAAFRKKRSPVVHITTGKDLAPAPSIVVASTARKAEEPDEAEKPQPEKREEKLTLLRRQHSGPLEVVF